MQVGLLVEVEEGLTWQRWRLLFGTAERLGFDSVWVSDHLCSASTAGRGGLDAWLALTVAAAETDRIRLGTLVSPVTFRPAAIVGRMAESVQALSGGRLTVGLGLGWNAAEHERNGLPFPSARERAALLEQHVASVRGVAPVLIGGSGERWTLPLAARCADAWNMTTGSAEAFAAKSVVLDRLCAEVGRDPRQIGRSVAVGCAVDEAPHGVDTTGWLVGSTEQIAKELRALQDVGAEQVMLGDYGQFDERSLETIASEVLLKLA